MAENRIVTFECVETSSTGKRCPLSIRGPEEEVVELAVHHGTRKHGKKDTPETRQQIRSRVKEEAAIR